MANAIGVKACRVEWIGSIVRFTLADGTVRDIDVAKFEPELYQFAAMHGVEQRGRDSMALQTKSVDGRNVVPTFAEKKEAFLRVWGMLDSGVWSTRGSGGTSNDTMLFRAVGEAYPAKFATLAAFDGWVTAEAKRAGVSKTAFKLSVANGKKVRPILDRMEREMAATVDVDGLLDNDTDAE